MLWYNICDLNNLWEMVPLIKEDGEKKSILYKEEQRLLIHSNILNSYPKLKTVIAGVESIQDLKDIEYLKHSDYETFSLLKGGIGEIVKQAQLEWYQHGYAGYSQKKQTCELCGNNSLRHIYKIKNRENDNILTVGSECIDKFPDIKGTIDGMSVQEHRNKQNQNLSKVYRTAEFNNTFGEINKIINRWKDDYTSLEMLTTREIDDRLNELISEAKTFYYSYINGRLKKVMLYEFEKILDGYSKLKEEYDLFVELNKEKEFTCDRNLAEWLNNNNLAGIIKLILIDKGIITEKTAKFIYNYEFVKKFENRFINAFKEYGFESFAVEREKVILLYRNPDVFIFEMDLKDFMSKFAFIIFNEKQLTLEYIVENIEIKNTLDNVSRLINAINKIFNKNKLSYHVSLYHYEGEVRVYDDDLFSKIKLKIFLKKYVRILFIEEEKAKDIFINNFSKISNWTSKEEESKFDIGNISSIWQN